MNFLTYIFGELFDKFFEEFLTVAIFRIGVPSILLFITLKLHEVLDKSLVNLDLVLVAMVVKQSFLFSSYS